MNRQANGSRVSGSLVFLQEFLKHPLQIGSVIPSSRFLEQRVVEAAGAADGEVIVELGPGVGGITWAPRPDC
jgi:phospholipid N-methyltransferase